MFGNFLAALREKKSEYVLTLELWKDVQAILDSENPNSDEGLKMCECALPFTPDWIMGTDWYKLGGWIQVRKAAYPSAGEQFGMYYDDSENNTNTLIEAQRKVKDRWIKPVLKEKPRAQLKFN